MKDKILITGGAGYIGSHTILELFEKEKFTVVSVDNYLRSSSRTYDRIEKISGKKPEIVEGDLTDIDFCKSLFASHQFKTIIHFAALKAVPESVTEPLLYYKNNLVSLTNLLEQVKAFKTPGFIFSSSCSVYGNIEKLPVNENTPFSKAESPYAYTKQIGERIIEDFSKTNADTRFINLRYFNPVGGHISGLLGETPIGIPNNLVPYITQVGCGIREKLTVFGGKYDTRDGTCIRDYIHVSDIARAHVDAIDFLSKSDKRYDVYNLGSGQGVTVLEAIKAFEKVSGKKLNYTIGEKREGDVEAIYSDSQKIYKDFKWQPRMSLEQMMETAWNWQLEMNKENGQ